MCTCLWVYMPISRFGRCQHECTSPGSAEVISKRLRQNKPVWWDDCHTGNYLLRLCTVYTHALHVYMPTGRSDPASGVILKEWSTFSSRFKSVQQKYYHFLSRGISKYILSFVQIFLLMTVFCLRKYDIRSTVVNKMGFNNF